MPFAVLSDYTAKTLDPPDILHDWIEKKKQVNQTCLKVVSIYCNRVIISDAIKLHYLREHKSERSKINELPSVRNFKKGRS